MQAERDFPRITVTEKGARWVGTGHPWIYESDIKALPQDLENGALADAVSEKGRYLGTGLVSLHSKIRLRLLSRNANERFDRAFWQRRLQYAWDYRKTVMGGELDACRLIFGEADGFPGLTVDKFHDLLSVQIASVGMEQRRDEILPLLAEVLEKDGFPVRGIFLRNDLALRDLEGLPRETGWYPLPEKALPDSPVTEITENGVRYLVDVAHGQKTGFFLDQKLNRLAVARLAKGRTVLDCFTHTGSFALNAALGGAAHVTAVDVSPEAIAMARENAERNGLQDRMDFVTADVFDYLPSLEKTRPFDFIILDPPAFTKSRQTAAQAERGYKEINLRALRLLPRGGYFATASCSHFMPSAQFERMLRSAALDAGRELRQIEARQQAPDHPILWNVPETDYLKFYLFQVV